MQGLATTVIALGMYALPTSATAEQIYLWADQSTAASYEPSPQYKDRMGSSANFAPRITRSGPGVYQVDLNGALLNESGGNVQVASYERNKYCKVASWANSKIDVRCFMQGAPTDSRFTVIASDGAVPGLGWAWVNASSFTLVSSVYAQSASGTPSATNPSTGVYSVSLPSSTPTGGNIQVTAYGTNSDYCGVTSWSGGSAMVKCFNASGTPSNTSFSILRTDASYAPSHGRHHFTWANNPTTTYAPAPGYTHAPDTNVSVRRRSQGNYEVQIGSLVTGGGAAIVTAYGSNAHCNATGWGGSGVVVECVAPNSAPIDSRFSLLAVRSKPPATESLVAVTTVSTSLAAPTVVATTMRQSLNVVEQLCIHSQCETAWDKSDDERDYDGTNDSDFEPYIRTSTLRYLCPVRRNTTDREFGGNGPDIRAFSTIDTGPEELELSAFFEAEETGSGSSIAFKTWRGTLYTPPDGWRITNVSATHSETSYRDSNHEEDTPPITGGNLVSEFRFKGDTGGDDIGNCTTDDTYMTVTYNPLTVTLAAEETGLRAVPIPEGQWAPVLEAKFSDLYVRLNNYDRTKSRPETERPEDKYYVNWSDVSDLSTLSTAEINMGSYYSYDDGPRAPLALPSIQRSTFTFLINDIVSTGNTNTVRAAGGHIRLGIRFEATDPEIVAACVDNIACGTGEPHEHGKPLLQVDGMKIIPYIRPVVRGRGASLRIEAEISRIRLEGDFARDGTCRDNTFAGLCQVFAGNLEKIAYDAVLERLDQFIGRSRGLTGLLDEQLTNGICQYVESIGESCGDLRDIVIDENGAMVMWFDD